MLFPIGLGARDDGAYDVERNVVALNGPMMLFRTDLFREIGLFDESYGSYGFEDFDFEFLTLSRGYDIVYTHRASARHAVSLSGAGLKSQRIRSTTRNRIILYRRFFRGWAFWDSLLAYTGFLFWDRRGRGYPFFPALAGHLAGIRECLRTGIKIDLKETCRLRGLVCSGWKHGSVVPSRRGPAPGPMGIA